ncbi:hypothetical protein KXD40_008850 [Peronospora effusa]|nr:hypothetical protein KXD40_008850 [Peronospora effusa]
MTLPTFVVASALCSLGLLSSSTEAHTVLREPQPCYNESLLAALGRKSMDPIQYLENVKTITVEENFSSWRKKMGYANLRDFMEDKSRFPVIEGVSHECGWSVRCKPKLFPENGILRTSGYLHNGTCEVWMNNIKLSSASNCHLAFPKATHCIDYSVCKGTCTLHHYWLAERKLKGLISQQVYKTCVVGTNGGRKLKPPSCKPIVVRMPTTWKSFTRDSRYHVVTQQRLQQLVLREKPVSEVVTYMHCTSVLVSRNVNVDAGSLDIECLKQHTVSLQQVFVKCLTAAITTSSGGACTQEESLRFKVTCEYTSSIAENLSLKGWG